MGRDGKRGMEEVAEELYVWQRLCGTVWDLLAKGRVRDVV
jgi:origin recognition complex subunit 5